MVMKNDLVEIVAGLLHSGIPFTVRVQKSVVDVFTDRHTLRFSSAGNLQKVAAL
jgi:hypothetical protein